MLEVILSQYSVFLLQLITIVGVIVLGVSLGKKATKEESSGELEILDLKEKYQEQKDRLESTFLSHKELKKREKEKKKEKKLKEEHSAEKKSRLFVIDFNGDVNASQVSQLREEITGILSIVNDGDEVLLRLESPGGVIDGYGLGASQLKRLRDKKIPLTVVVDKVAASGGYMMACVADKIVATPFSEIGSIGVVAQVPNIHRLLKKHDVDVDVMTAGKYKRTVTFLGENTEEGKKKFSEELNVAHELFKSFVSQHRPQIQIDEIATGEFWYGTQALALNLVDALGASDDLILNAMEEKDIYLVQYKQKESFVEKLGSNLEFSLESILKKILYYRSGKM